MPGGGKHMLKITKRTENVGTTRVGLHGSFTGEYVREVEKALSENAGRVVLNLENVTLVDRTAMEFLSTARSRKLRIENMPSYVARWIQQEVS
jgi:hypothetical protein